MTMRLRSATRSRRAAAALATALLLVPGPARGALADGEIEARVRSLLADPSFQTELPFGHGEGAGGGSPSGSGVGDRHGEASQRPVEPEGSTGRTAGGRPSTGSSSGGAADRPLLEGGPDVRNGPRRRDAARLDLPVYRGGGAEVVKALFFVLLAALVAVLLFALVNAVRRNRRLETRLEDDGGGEGGGPARVAAAPSESELEALVRTGRLAEAVHLLLRLALENVASRAGGLPASLTSREVLGRGGLEGDDRRSLATLVEAVERSLFGGLPVTPREYETCAAAFARLAGRGAAA